MYETLPFSPLREVTPCALRSPIRQKQRQIDTAESASRFISRGQPRKPGGVPRLPELPFYPHFIPPFSLWKHHLNNP